MTQNCKCFLGTRDLFANEKSEVFFTSDMAFHTIIALNRFLEVSFFIHMHESLSMKNNLLLLFETLAFH